MTLEESEAEADRIFSEAGWTTTLKPPWNGRHVAPGLVGGRAPDGNAYVKAYTAFAQSEAAAMGLDPAAYPDEPHEAAAVLVASVQLAPAPEAELPPRSYDEATAEYFAEYPEDATHGEAVSEADVEVRGAERDDDPAPERDVEDVDPGSEDAGLDDALSAESPIDADFTLETIELIPPDSDPDFGADVLTWEGELADTPQEEAPAGAFIFGDNIHQMRTAAIGLVVQISLSRQAAIWADAGAEPDEFGALTSAVVRDTIDGAYRGPQAVYDRFVFLSQHDSAARRVQATERERVTMLTTATREEIEAFEPEAGWP